MMRPPALTLVTPPASLPLTLDIVKAHARIDADLTDEDALIQGYLRAAVEMLDGRDGILNRCLLTQEWEARFDGFPAVIQVPLPKLQSVTSIQYLDTAGTLQTLATSVYQVDSASTPGRITPAEGQVWPTVQASTYHTVRLRFQAGYGDSWNDVPETLRLAIQILTLHWYEHREPVALKAAPAMIPWHVDALLANYVAHY